jgi:hypothetical protein
MPNLTFVSVLIHNPADPNPVIKRLDWLLQLLRANLPLVLYVDPYYGRLLEGAERSWPSLRLQPFDLNDAEIPKHIAAYPDAALPTYRTPAKDTRFFMTLMNTKTELVARASRDGLVKTPFVAFLDASIAKVLKKPVETLEALKKAQVPANLATVMIPGCWPITEPLSEEHAWNRICWTFCGGLFVVPTAKALEWHVRCREQVLEFLRAGHLTWETNVWAYLLSRQPALCKWFAADHDDRMLTIPTS